MALQRIKMYYDPRGQVIRTVNPDDTEQRVVYGVPNTLALVSSSEVENPSPWETYSFDANDLDSTCNHYATPKSAEVDALGRTIKTLDRLESSNSTANNVQMLYEYDIRGNLLNVKDAYDRTVFEHVYDLQTPAKEGESIPPLKTTHINKGTSTVIFDCTGKPVETRDAKDSLTLHAYDTLHRPYAIWTRDNGGESATLRMVSIYGTSVGTNSNGKIYQQFDEAGFQQINSYDFKGNVLEKYNQVISDNEILNTISTWSGSGWGMNPAPCYRVDWGSASGPNIALLDGRQYQTNMEYDGLNRLKKITYPADNDNNRKELVPLYNKAGALQKVQFDGTDYVKEIAYNAKGQRLLIAYGNGLMTRYTYNVQTFRLTRLKTEGYTYSQTGNEHQYDYNAGTVKQDFAYTYDKGGNILSINDETPSGGISGADGLERTFEYDALYRLLAASGRENTPSSLFWNDTSRSDDPHSTSAYTQNYEYDLMGNISELAHSGSSGFTRDFSYTDNLLNNISVGGTTYTFNYDICGNQIQENTERFFQWDYADRMRLYYNQASLGTEPSVISHYLYDAGGNRVKKLTRVSGGNWESLTYIDGLIEYREDNTGQKQSISHIMDDSKRIASVRKGSDFGDTTPEIKYNLDDHLGSSNLSVDENGTLVNREEYYPFGETSFGSYSKKRYRFCGKEKDEESGLYYYGARYYSPWTCRFISVDPLAGKYPFYTAYQYAGNKPINFIDLDGMEEAKPAIEKPKRLNPTEITRVRMHHFDPNNPRLLAPDGTVWEDKFHKTTYVAGDTITKQGDEGAPQIIKTIHIFYGYGVQQIETKTENPSKAILITTQLATDKPAANSIVEKKDAEKVVQKEIPKNNHVKKQKKDEHNHIKPPKPVDINVDFQISSDKFENEKLAMAEIKKLADYLKANPSEKVVLQGNVYMDDANLFTNVNSPRALNGGDSTIGGVMLARANAIGNVLIQKYGINKNRISTVTGVFGNDVKNLKVNLTYKK